MAIKTAVFAGADGKCKLTYRTEMTVADQTRRSFIWEGWRAQGNTQVGGDVLGRWCLEQFGVALEWEENGEIRKEPFSWALLELLPRTAMPDGFIVEAAAEIYTRVVETADKAAAELKKA